MTTITLSMEVELGWGVHDFQGYHRLSPERSKETRFLKELLSACDKYELPFSFDVVGHLLLEQCNGQHSGPYPEHWFSEDPGTSVDQDPIFYAPDLVDEIRQSNVEHEICTHSFSHIDCEKHTPETIAHDLELAQDLHVQKMGQRTSSFVPPKHKDPPLDVLQETGIDVIRVGKKNIQSKVGKFKTLSVGPHPVFEDEFEDRVKIAHCSSYSSLTSALLPAGQRSVHPAFRYLPLTTSTRVRLHRRWLNQAVKTAIANDTSLHLWCHLYDIACEEQWRGISLFLSDLALYQKRANIEIKKLEDL